MQIRVLNAAEMCAALPMPEAIEGMKRAFCRLSEKRCEMPLRSSITIPDAEGVLLTMPAAIPDDGEMAVKLVSVYGANPSRDLPLIHAVVLVFDAQTGIPSALMDGEVLTAVRTGAGSGAATDALANPDASEAAILGSGSQARTQLEAVCSVREIRRVRVYSPNSEHAGKFAAEMSGKGPVPDSVHAVIDPALAVRGADVVCTATTSNTPVFAFEDLKPGAHVNAVGSFQPSMQEIDTETIQQSMVVVDSRESAFAETGDLLVPLRQGLINKDHVHAKLGEILNGNKPGRTRVDQFTFFKSCGVAVQDAVATRIALNRAEQDGLGQIVSL